MVACGLTGCTWWSYGSERRQIEELSISADLKSLLRIAHLAELVQFGLQLRAVIRRCCYDGFRHGLSWFFSSAFLAGCDFACFFRYYLRGDPKERAPGDQHRTTPNAHLTAPWPMELGWGVSGDNLSATFMPRLCVYGR